MSGQVGKNEALKHPWEGEALLPSLLGANVENTLHQEREGTIRGTRGKMLILPPEPKPHLTSFC